MVQSALQRVKMLNMFRRQREIDAKKKESGITEEDIDNYFQSRLALKAERLSWQEPRHSQIGEMDCELVRNHLITSLILQNHGRNSEVVTIEGIRDFTVPVSDPVHDTEAI